VGRRSVFISYRRQLSWSLAKLIRKDLIEHRFDTFMDVENLDGGEFPGAILSQIKAREHFVVLLEPGSLDRISEDGDWLRREISHALAHRRNVVPVTANGFEFRRGLVLPPEVAKLASFNAVSIPSSSEYFDAAMERLRTFLKKPPNRSAPLLRDDIVIRPGQRTLPSSGEPMSAGASVLPAPQLTWARSGAIKVKLSWSEVPGASEYVLERDGSVVYRGPFRSYSEVRTTSHTLRALSHYRVRANAPGRDGMWSRTEKVRTGLW